MNTDLNVSLQCLSAQLDISLRFLFYIISFPFVDLWFLNSNIPPSLPFHNFAFFPLLLIYIFFVIISKFYPPYLLDLFFLFKTFIVCNFQPFFIYNVILLGE